MLQCGPELTEKIENSCNETNDGDAIGNYEATEHGANDHLKANTSDTVLCICQKKYLVMVPEVDYTDHDQSVA
jgi:hypothetical protein